MPRDIILYARYSYLHNNMLPFSDIILIFSIVLVFNQERMRERFVTSYYVTLRHHVFRLWLHACN